MSLLSEISDSLKDIRWIRKDGNQQSEVQLLKQDSKLLNLSGLPMKEELKQLFISDTDTCKHICGVVASVNDLLSGEFKLSSSGDINYDNRVHRDLLDLQNFCLTQQSANNRNTVIQDLAGYSFVRDFLRVAALYHDMGKIVALDRHVSRGVHLMRDVSDEYRIAFEQQLLKGSFEDKHNFWTLLSHHDTFGVLGTGEASLAALSQMVSWSGDYTPHEPHKSPAALVSYLLLLNLADGDSSLRFYTKLDGLRSVEARRYLEDWRTVRDLLWDNVNVRPLNIPREEFIESLLLRASHPERTIERITRIITTSYRMNIPNDLLLSELEVKKLVEDELEMLHGAKFRLFCYLFSRFCKIDYGRRFFDIIMLFELMDEQHGLLRRIDNLPDYEYPDKYEPVQDLSNDEWTRRRSACLKEMTRRVCSILKRFVDDYGELVKGDPRSAPLMCIVMANLMPQSEKKTAWAICRALKKHESRALAWISEEVAVSPYGG